MDQGTLYFNIKQLYLQSNNDVIKSIINDYETFYQE